jgi:hypothetical protein
LQLNPLNLGRPTKSARAAGSLLTFLLLAFAVMAMPVSAAHAATQSTLTVTSKDSAGNVLTGYYTALYNSQGNPVSTGYTPNQVYVLIGGQSYTVVAENSGNCRFSSWADTGSASYLRTITISSDTRITAIYNCSNTTGASASSKSGGGSSVKITAVDTNNNALTGYYVTLLNASGNKLQTGFTPVTLKTTSGTTYGVQASGFGKCIFAKWSDGVVNNPRSFTATGASISFAAIYNCGASSGSSSGSTSGAGSITKEGGAGPGTITIYDHRISAYYWADCFAANCTNPSSSCDTACTGPGAAMWVILYNSAGNVVATGFSNENGLTFTGLNPSTTYYLYPSDCDLCHGSTHDVLFSHWGANNDTTTRPLAVVANGAYVDAWYTCTNGCGGI